MYRFQVIGRAYLDMMVYAVQELHMAIEGRYCRVDYVAMSEKYAANKTFMTLTELDAMERELSSLPPPAPATPQPQPFVEPLSSEFSTASAFETTTPKAPSEIALSPFVVLHHESTHYGVLGGGFVFRGPSRIVVLDSDGRTALDSDVTFEIPGYIEVVGERGGTAAAMAFSERRAVRAVTAPPLRGTEGQDARCRERSSCAARAATIRTQCERRRAL